MKKWMAFAFVSALLLVPATVYAGIVFVPITEVVYSDLGDTTAGRSPDGEIEILTQGLRGAGTVDCDGVAVCFPPELDSSTFDIRQDVELAISAADGQGVTVSGRSRGNLRFPSSGITLPDTARFRFRGDIVGRARCVDATAGSCQTAVARMRLQGPVIDATSGVRVGGLRLVMTGTLALREGGAWAPTWTEFAAEGAFGLPDGE